MTRVMEKFHGVGDEACVYRTDAPLVKGNNRLTRRSSDAWMNPKNDEGIRLYLRFPDMPHSAEFA